MLRWNASQVNKGLGPLLRNDAWYGDGYIRDCQGDDYECEEFRALASWVYIGFTNHFNISRLMEHGIASSAADKGLCMCIWKSCSS